MSPNLPPKSGSIPNGVFVIGRALGDFTLKSGVSAKGRPYQFVEGQVVAGTTFVKVNESVELGAVPFLPKDGEEVRATIVPDFKANGILAVSVKVARPEVVAVTK